mgnify:CR=1 FL=1
MTLSKIKTPFYIVYENRLRKNLELIKRVSIEADVNIIMAFKANALWKTFNIIKTGIRSNHIHHTITDLYGMYF